MAFVLKSQLFKKTVSIR